MWCDFNPALMPFRFKKRSGDIFLFIHTEYSIFTNHQDHAFINPHVWDVTKFSISFRLVTVFLFSFQVSG